MSRLPVGRARYAELSSQSSTPAETNGLASNYGNPTPSDYVNQYPDQTYDQQPIAKSQGSHMTSYMNSGQPERTNFVEKPSTTSMHSQIGTTPSTSTATTDPKARRKSSKSRQIDIDKIPRPDIVAQSSYSPQTFATNTYSPPPASYTNFITVDDGNAGPRYVRSTFYKIPTTESLLNTTHIPLSLIIQPLADPSPDEEAVPIMDYGEQGPLRCNRCRAYISPNWTFLQNGSAVMCNLCKMINDVPKEYYSPLDVNGNRMDKLERPELSKGVYEFVAPSSYHMRPLVTSNILFCVEASSASYLSGIFHQIFSSIQSLLDYIPSPELTKICIATYDTGINFFKVPDDLTKEMSVIHITDTNASCMPYPKSYLFLSLQDERDKINYLIERIIKFYESNEKLQKGVNGTCFGAALVDCCDILLKEGGRVVAFTTQAPSTGIGKIQKRDDPKVFGTEKEKSLYASQLEEYVLWAKRALEKRISIDIFCFSPEYFDFATIGQMCGITGGNIYYYPNYRAGYDSEKLHYDLARNLTRYTGFDAIMTVRTCQGIEFQEYVTPTGKKTEAELEFSAIDADTAVNVYLKYDDKLSEDNASFQVAMLYSNPYGQRVIRVLNFKTNTSNDLITIYRSCDAETVAQSIIKRNIVTLPTSTVPHIKKTLIDVLVNILYNYRHHCANTSSQSQLILPESLKVLPLYFLAAFKAQVLRPGNDIKPDARTYDIFRFTKLPLNVLSNLLYPKLYELHTIWTDEEVAPGNLVNERVVLGSNIATTVDKIDDNGIYLLDNGETLFLYVKREVDPIYLQHLFGVETYQEVANLQSFPESVESEYFTKVCNIIDQLRKNKNSSYQPVRIVTEKDPFEQHLLNLLVEDERLGESYSIFLCNIHKAIQEKFA